MKKSETNWDELKGMPESEIEKKAQEDEDSYVASREELSQFKSVEGQIIISVDDDCMCIIQNKGKLRVIKYERCKMDTERRIEWIQEQCFKWKPVEVHIDPDSTLYNYVNHEVLFGFDIPYNRKLKITPKKMRGEEKL